MAITGHLTSAALTTTNVRLVTSDHSLRRSITRAHTAEDITGDASMSKPQARVTITLTKDSFPAEGGCVAGAVQFIGLGSGIGLGVFRNSSRENSQSDRRVNSSVGIRESVALELAQGIMGLLFYTFHRHGVHRVYVLTAE